MTKGLAIFMAVSGVLALPHETTKNTARQLPDPPAALDENAPEDTIKFQPVLDYDTDSCYNVAAIDKDGNVAQGLDTKGDITEGCREPKDLDNQNVYVRKRCNGDWCVAL